MNYTEFRDLVRKMRSAQHEYFKTRAQAALRAAKDYEYRVDAELNRPTAGLFTENTKAGA